TPFPEAQCRPALTGADGIHQELIQRHVQHRSLRRRAQQLPVIITPVGAAHVDAPPCNARVSATATPAALNPNTATLSAARTASTRPAVVASSLSAGRPSSAALIRSIVSGGSRKKSPLI